MNLRLHGEPIIDADAGRAQIAPLAPEDRLGQICVQEVVVRGSASADTVWPKDYVHGIHTIAKVEDEAVDHRVVNGDDFLRSVPFFCPRKADSTGAAAER